MLASTQNLLALAAVLPLLATAAPFVKRSDVKPFYLKPNKDQSQVSLLGLDTYWVAADSSVVDDGRS